MLFSKTFVIYKNSSLCLIWFKFQVAEMKKQQS